MNTRTIASALLALTAFVALTTHVAPASAVLVDAWPTEYVDDDTPECFLLEDYATGAAVVRFSNQCDTTVTLTLLDCTDADCGELEADVPAGEWDAVGLDRIGLSYEDFEPGDSFEMTWGWSMAPDKEGTFTAEVSHQDASYDGGGGCACGSQMSPDGRSDSPAGTLGIVFIGLALIRPRR
jgi:hypothetical protein